MAKSSTQDILEFDQIRDGLIVLKNKSLRAVIMVSSLNFSLKSEEEQEAIIYQFQEFLNSLDFFSQILIQSRRINMTGYIERLKEMEQKEKHELLKIQLTNYRSFVEELLAGGQIMQKSFYIIIPFSFLETKKVSGLKEIKGKTSSFTEQEFQRAKMQLLQRVEFVILGLRRCGLQAVPLNSAEIIDLLWSFYHPQEAEKGYYPEIPPELIS